MLDIILAPLVIIVSIAFILLPFFVFSINGKLEKMLEMQRVIFKKQLKSGKFTLTELDALWREGYLTKDEAMEIGRVVKEISEG